MFNIFEKLPFNRDKISKILEAIKPFKLPIILLLIFGVFNISVKWIIPTFNNISISNSPVKEIEATCSKNLLAGSNIDIRDFKVVAIHKNGRKSKIASSKIKASPKKVPSIGSSANITLCLKKDEKIKCKTEIKIAREKVVTFEVGYPNPPDVKATLYTSGEFAFSGKGNIMTFEEGDMPWLNSDNIDLEETPIKSVTFGKNVKPVSLNYFFEDLETLTYISPIPDTVQSMYKTFCNCSSLEKTADWTACGVLLDISEAYNGCYSLSYIHTIPGNVRKANYSFEGCSELLETADMTQASSLIECAGMYSGCKKLTSAQIGPVVEDASEMYYGCVNLKATPEFPDTLVNMESMFLGDESLSTCMPIPKSVKHTGSTFYGCRALSGEITINCNNTDFSGMFEGACIATQVNLVGNSVMLDVFANTCEAENVFVNGYSADQNISSYEDATNKAKEIEEKAKKKEKSKKNKKADKKGKKNKK